MILNKILPNGIQQCKKKKHSQLNGIYPSCTRLIQYSKINKYDLSHKQVKEEKLDHISKYRKTFDKNPPPIHDKNSQ